MFLTIEEMETLTGYKVAACQVRWLDKHGWTHIRAAGGRPVVLRSHAEAKLSGQVANTEWKPNLAAIRKVA